MHELSAVQQETVEGFSLSPQQRHVWSLQQASDTQPYRVQGAILIEGAIDRKRLDRAWRRIVKRHEILHTTFPALPEMTFPVQVVTGEIVPIGRTHDLTGMHPENQELAIVGIEEELRQRPFDLQHDPPLRLSFVKLSTERHLLFVSASAFCADAFTLRKLATELGCLYADRQPLADPAQYADLAEWQNQVLEEESAGAGREFWREQVSDELFTSTLPFENRTQAQKEFRPHFLTSTVDPEVAKKLVDLAHRHQTSFQTLLLTCWHVLIWRLTTQQDVVVTTSFNGRNHEGLENVLGPFEKYLPVHSLVNGNKSFFTLLEEIDEVLHTATILQESFSWQLMHRPGDKTHPFMAALSFAFEPQPEEYRAGSVSFSMARRYACTDRFKLKLCCLENGGQLTAEFHYDADQLSRETVHAVSDYYRRLLESVAETPDPIIRELEILTGAQRERLLFTLNNASTAVPAVECVQQLFDEQVHRYPDETAVVFEDQQLTYKELNNSANQLAHYLRRLGVGPEVCVGFCVERSATMIVAMLGILKAGGAYVPLESNQPATRLIEQLHQARAQIVLTQESLSPLWADFEGAVLFLDRDRQTWSGYPEENPSVVNIPDHLAYVLFTSGSTGTPKAVGVSHRSLINYAGNICRMIGVPDTRMNFAMVTPISADLCMTALYGGLLAGGCLHIVGYDVVTSGAGMAAYMRAHEIDVLKIVPSHLSALLATGGADVIPRRFLFVGGEALSTELAHRIRSLGRNCELINHYGPTEATVGSVVNPVDEEYETVATVPIGRPLGNTQAYILDQWMHLSPPGVAGELYLGGAGLARGYLNDAARTAERFVPHPFARIPGERLYRTGDLARYVTDDRIEFIGRVDHQVKLSGYRIEPGEIEATLKQHEGVREAIVMLREDVPGHKRLVAYVVPDGAHAPLLAGRERYRLPNQMAIAQQNRYETDFFYKQIFVDQSNTKYLRLPPGACVFDVGANIGLFTLFISQGYDGAKIYAFEPVPPVFALLQANATLYGSNVTLYNRGLANESKSVTFTYYPHLSCMSGYYADEKADRETLLLILQHQQEERPELASLTTYLDEIADDRTRSESFICHLTTISDVIRENKIARIDLLKIDVEKSEFDVLEGIADQDWNKIRNIVIEAHDVDGQLQRLTTLLKNRGYHVRVEEDSSLSQTGLFNVYAATEPFEPGADIRISNDRLIASNSQPLSPSEIQSYVGERLPWYMIPSAIVILDSLPLTSNGKVDRAALPAPEQLRAGGVEYVAPRDEIENIIAGIWGRVLGEERIGVYDDYFAIGGDSIRVIQIVHELNQYGLALAAIDVVQHRTIGKLAQHLRETKIKYRAGGPPTLTSPPPEELLGEGIEDAYPAAQMQEYVSYYYLHDRQQAGVYHIQQSFHVYDDDLSIAAFKQAIDFLVEHHPVLRTTFRPGPNGRTFQVLHKKLPAEIREQHIEQLTAAQQEQYLSAALVRDRDELFDITSEDRSLFRPTIFHRSKSSAEFLLSFHHAITDGWGNQQFLSDLVQLYSAFKRGHVPQHEPLTNTYKEFIALEHEITSSEEAALFWRHHLSNHRGHALPRRVSEAESAAEINYVEELDPELVAHLRRTSRAQGVSLKSVLLHRYLELIGAITGEEQVTVGVISNGRSERLSEPLKALGLFWNIIPFCCAVAESDHVSGVTRVQQLLVDTELYARYPLPQILKDRQLDSLFSATFNFIHFPKSDGDASDSDLRVLNARFHDKFHFPLNYVVSLDGASENINLRVEYDKSYFGGNDIRALTGDYIRLLAR